jgi:glycosyltransferase involved in cell wall biosynthesis
MHKDLDIIYFTLFPWDNAYSSVSLSFTREFAKNNRVFYINHPLSVKDFIGNLGNPLVKERTPALLQNKMRYEQIPGLPDNVIAAQPPLTLPVNWMNDGPLYRKLMRYNNQKVLNTIQKVIDDYNIKNYIYLNCYNPYYAAVLPDSFSPKLNIYQCIDDMMEEAYTARHGFRLEEEAIRKADVTVVTSRNLRKLKAPLNPNTHILHNAVDINIFKNAVEKEYPKPQEIQGIEHKIIGFMGNMDPNRIDYQLMKDVALHHKDKTLLLIGPINSDTYTEVGLDKVPNIIATGSKDINDLPQYLQYMDCTIIPFLCNKLTASIYPLKINEYLASGKPVVSTSFSEDIRSFSDVVYLAEDKTTFLSAIETAIQEDDADKKAARINVANQNTWTARVQQFWEIVDRHLVDAVVQ